MYLRKTLIIRFRLYGNVSYSDRCFFLKPYLRALPETPESNESFDVFSFCSIAQVMLYGGCSFCKQLSKF